MRPSDNLFLLIKSLTKSEKREFKLLAQRYKNSTTRLAIRLYEIIDKLPEFDETKIIQKFTSVLILVKDIQLITILFFEILLYLV